MNCKSKVKNLFSYLLSIKKMDEGVITNLNQYEKLFWQVNLKAYDKFCIKNDPNKEEWLEIDKSNKVIYDELFKLYLQLQKNSDNLEIVWGNYILSWNVEDKKIIKPIFTTKMELDFDAEIGRFLLKPYDGKTKMELDMFVGMNIPNMEKIIEIKNEIESMTFDPRNIEDTENILNKTAHYLSSDINPEGEIKKEECGPVDIKTSKYPVFFNAPVIIVRKIDNRLWNNELANILRLIDKGYSIPATIQALIEEKEINEEPGEKDKWKELDNNILFPLPSNEEQREVVHRLSNNYGVVVQGPPGTGKSHTIVNLICHLLAHGKRVLVTSQTGRALRVLSERIPEEIKPLCISILGDDTKSLKELDESVRIITENLAVNPESLKQEIIPLRKQLTACKNRQKELYEQLKQTEAIEYKNLNYNGKVSKLMDIAKWVRENEEHYSWIEDDIKLASKCPITDEEMDKLIKLLNKIDDDDLMKVNSFMSTLEELPSLEKICSEIEIIREINENYDEYRENLKYLSIPQKANINNYKELEDILEKAEKRMKEIENSWLKNVINCYYNSEVMRPIIKHLYMKTNYYVEELSNIERQLAAHKIIVQENVDFLKLKKDFKEIYAYITKKGKIGVLYILFHRRYNYILKGCSIDENFIRSKEQAETMNLYINKKIIEMDLMNLWNSTMVEYGALHIENYNVDTMVKVEKSIKKLGSIIDWNFDIRNKIKAHIGEIEFIKDMNWYESDTYLKLKEGLEGFINIKKYDEAKAFIKNVWKLCLSTECMKVLGSDIEKMDIKKIKDDYKAVYKLKILIPKAKEIKFYINKLEEVVPVFTMRMKSSKDRTKFVNFNKAFKWKQLSGILYKTHMLKPEIIEDLMENERTKENLLIKQIVPKEAWYNQIINTNESQKRSLYAWMQAVKRIGKGTGKYADKYRSMAQRNGTMQGLHTCLDYAFK